MLDEIPEIFEAPRNFYKSSVSFL